MESVRRNDGEIDRSDDSSQDNENPTSRAAIRAILDKLTSPPVSETSGKRDLHQLARLDARAIRRYFSPYCRHEPNRGMII